MRDYPDIERLMQKGESGEGKIAEDPSTSKLLKGVGTDGKG